MLERFTWYRQSAYLWKGDGLNVYIDPWGVTGDPPADVAFLPIGGTYTMTAAEAAEAAKAISPQVAVPMHYGFVVGTPADAETFRRESSPVTVEVLQPQNPFEKT